MLECTVFFYFQWCGGFVVTVIDYFQTFCHLSVCAALILSGEFVCRSEASIDCFCCRAAIQMNRKNFQAPFKIVYKLHFFYILKTDFDAYLKIWHGLLIDSQKWMR